MAGWTSRGTRCAPSSGARRLRGLPRPRAAAQGDSLPDRGAAGGRPAPRARPGRWTRATWSACASWRGGRRSTSTARSPDAEVIERLGRAMALVHPTPVDASGSAGAHELFGLALVEAMARGCPVIASDAASLPEIVTPEVNGLLVPPNRPEAIGAAILRLQRRSGSLGAAGARGPADGRGAVHLGPGGRPLPGGVRGAESSSRSSPTCRPPTRGWAPTRRRSPERSGGEARFLVGAPRPGPNGERRPGGAGADGGQLLAAIGAEETVLLHYANYGYQPRGCPTWLVGGPLAGAGAGRRLVDRLPRGLGHRPALAQLVLARAPSQRRLAAALARPSDALVTSLEHLRRHARAAGRAAREIAVLPVFSTVGEPAAVPPLAERARRHGRLRRRRAPASRAYGRAAAGAGAGGLRALGSRGDPGRRAAARPAGARRAASPSGALGVLPAAR